MGNFNGKVKKVKVTDTSSANNYLIIVEVEDPGSQVVSVEVKLPVKFDPSPDPAQCICSLDNNGGYFSYTGNVKTNQHISESNFDVTVIIILNDGTEVTVKHPATKV
jgi:hypothetical protein